MRTIILLTLSTAGLLAQNLSVVNGARFEVKYPVSPGSYAQAYGTFAGVNATPAATIPLPTTLDGVQVLINDVPAPLIDVRSTVLSFLVPGATAAGRASVRVVKGGAALATGTVDVVERSPGVFFVLNDPLAQGGVLNQSSQYAVQGSPAARGGRIQIFGTGQGPVSASVPDGAAPPPGQLVTARGVTKVFVSVDEAVVEFSGLSPQFPGLWQINAIVPDKPYVAGQVPLVVTIDGVPSNQTSFWVAQ